jgi:hypothetical protein
LNEIDPTNAKAPTARDQLEQSGDEGSAIPVNEPPRRLFPDLDVNAVQSLGQGLDEFDRSTDILGSEFGRLGGAQRLLGFRTGWSTTELREGLIGGWIVIKSKRVVQGSTHWHSVTRELASALKETEVAGAFVTDFTR